MSEDDDVHVGKLAYRLGQELLDSYDPDMFATRVVMFVVGHDVKDNSIHTLIAHADTDGDDLCSWEMFGAAEAIRIEGVDMMSDHES